MLRPARHSRAVAAAADDPDILLVPLAAFDRAGHRIGYGAGHYDRTLAQLRAAKTIAAIGLAFAAQEIRLVPPLPTTRAGLCANGERDSRFPELMIAHSFRRRRGRQGRPHRHLGTSARHDPRLGARSRHRQRRELRRRLRHHRGDLPGIHRRRRRRGHARQPCLGPARGAGVHRACAAADSPGEFSEGHARPRRRAGRYQERQARAGHQCHRPRLHDAVRRSLRRDRPANSKPVRWARRPMPSWSISTARRPARSRASDFSATAAPASWSAPIPTCRPPIIRSCPAAPPT